MRRYRPFTKCFYDEHPEVFAADFAENAAFMLEKDVSCSGRDAPNPIREFAHCSFDDGIVKDLQRLQYLAPTGIQCCALPAALSGRDVLGLAATGSGKTAAFVLPLIVHVKAAPPAPYGGGPTALILAPTRELAQQIYMEVKRLSKHSRLVIAVVFGGIGKYVAAFPPLCICNNQPGTSRVWRSKQAAIFSWQHPGDLLIT